MVENDTSPTGTCQICKAVKPLDELLPAELVRPAVAEVIVASGHPEFTSSGLICQTDLNHFRGVYVQQALEDERGELSDLEQEVVRSLRERELLTRDTNAVFDRANTVGDRVADRVASFGGSWTFIILFGGIIVLWIAVNAVALLGKAFDPYPYILLNLVLSCVAAMQAPIIMMSQNRQEAKDRLRAENDYQINLKAELEIRHVNTKLDMLLTHQWRRLVEIQQIQLDLLNEMNEHHRWERTVQQADKADAPT